MNSATMKRFCGVAAVWTLGWMAFNCGAEVFYGGDTKGFRGDHVELTINARAGTVLEGIDIKPNFSGVASVLHDGFLQQTLALTDGGSALCNPGVACSVTYDPFTGKTFSADAVLATVSFTIDPAAPFGAVSFDPRVSVNLDPKLEIPTGQGFEVLIPEPSRWALLLAGVFGIAWAMRRRSAVVSVTSGNRSRNPNILS